MSRLNSKATEVKGLDYVVAQIGNVMRDRGAALVGADHTDALLSMESIDSARLRGANDIHLSLESELTTIYSNAYEDLKKGFGMEGAAIGELTATQREAGAIVLGAAGNPVAYAKKAYGNLYPTQAEGVEVIAGSASSFGVESYPSVSTSLEAFDEQELRNHIAWSAAFNLLAARQGELPEAFFPTVVLTPDQAGLDITIRTTMVLFEVQHRLNGEPIDFDKRNLIEAAIDHTILQNESNRLYPVVVAAGADQNTTKFVASADVAPYNKTIEDGVTVLTAPLKLGVQINLLGISQRNDIQTQGTFNSSDALDASLRLQNLYLKVANTDGTSVVPFNVSHAPRNQWVKSVEGRGREMNLVFTTNDLKIDGLTEAVAGGGVPAAALAYLQDPARAGWTVSLAVNVSGSADVEKGNVQAQAGAVEIVRISNKVGDVVTDITAAEIAALRTALGTMTLIGYDVYATRCNANLRNRGLLLNSVDRTERWTLNLGAPLTIPSPVNSNRDASDLATLINAVRVRNDNNAVTTIFNYAEALEQLEQSKTSKLPVPAIEGIARYVLRRPWFERKPLNLVEYLNSIKSQDRIGDVQAALVNLVRDAALRMYRDSGYQSALDALTGNSGEKPIVLVGTDQRLAQYIYTPGDTRTLGNGLGLKIVTTPDQRFYGKIVVTLTRASQNGADPLSFGQFAWVPELASTTQVSRFGATTREAIVQTRSRHIPNLPLMAVFEIEGLDEAVTKTIVYRTDEV